MAAQTTDTGVIVGRFQVHDLHDAQRAIIEKRSGFGIERNHVGVSATLVTKHNPLDFLAFVKK